jgi:hypothetical protein
VRDAGIRHNIKYFQAILDCLIVAGEHEYEVQDLPSLTRYRQRPYRIDVGKYNKQVGFRQLHMLGFAAGAKSRRMGTPLDLRAEKKNAGGKPYDTSHAQDNCGRAALVPRRATAIRLLPG